MPVFSLLPFAKPAFNIAQSLLSKQKKPKREDFIPSTDFIRRFVANLRSRKESSEIQNLLLQPELRRIGAEGRSAFRDIEKSFARVGAPEGAIAEARTGIARTTITGISEATGKARALQLQENRRLEERIDRALLQEGRIQSFGDLSFRRAETGFEESERRRKIGLLGGVVDLAVAGLGEVGRAKALAAQETTEGLARLRDISTKAAASFQKKFGEFAPELIGQAIDSAGLDPAELKSGDFNRISREIKKIRLSNFENLLKLPDLNVATVFESAERISKEHFNVLLRRVEKTTGETISSVQAQTIDIFTSDKTPAEKVVAINKQLDGITKGKDFKFALSLYEKVRRQESQSLTASERETKKRTDVTEGVTRISEMLTDITNINLFPVSTDEGVNESKTLLNETLQKIRRDGTITKDEISNLQIALQTLIQSANIPSSGFRFFDPEGNITFEQGGNPDRAKLVLLNSLRNKFFRILDLLDITIESPENASGLSKGEFINQLRSLLGGG